LDRINVVTPVCLTASKERTLAVQDILAVIFGLVALAGIIGGAVNRFQLRKGIGAQFIRYIAMVIALPAGAALAFQGMLNEAAVSVLLGALGYAFPGPEKDER
jgi:hypothetical protein